MQSLILLPWAFALVTAFTSIQTNAGDERITTSTRAKFVSGGVGEKSNARMEALSADFNLRMLFAAKDQHHIADVAVAITDARGNKILDTVALGPRLLVTLAPGKYVITATYEGSTLRWTTTIPATGWREVFFRWEDPK